MPHGIRDLTLGEIAQLAGECAQAAQSAKGASALERIREWKDRSLVATETGEVHQAAKEGRVQILCVAASTADDYLVNGAVVETLSHGGEVHCVSVEAMSPGCPVIALMRY